MFSFFKFLQNSLKNLKKNKGLWFTILGILSVSGIFLCLFILNNLTENVSKDVYKNISSNYIKSFKDRVYKQEESFRKVLTTIETNNFFIDNINKNNIPVIEEQITSYNKNFKEIGFKSLELSFYPVLNQINQYRNSVNSVIASKSKAYGVEVLRDGIFFIYIEPIIKDDVLIGILELKEELYEFKAEYSRVDTIFAFLLEERMLNQLSIKARNGKYREVVNSMQVEELKYDGQFYGKIIDAGNDEFKQMLDVGYSVDDTYFRTAQKLSDINGNIIGVVVLGETVEGSGGFVNIVDNMTKTVTTVALGLVISILLFMF